MSFMSQKGTVSHNFDLNNVPLNGELPEDDNLNIRSSHETKLGLKVVQRLKLLKASYGLKKAMRTWTTNFLKHYYTLSSHS